MKRCPKCNAGYFDNMLEFCLEDGTKLVGTSETAAAVTQKNVTPMPATYPPGPMTERSSEETVVMPGHVVANPAVSTSEGIAGNTRIQEFAPVVLALLHNWWQWVYLEKVYVYSWTDYLLSANFLMWLLLLASGTAAGLYSAKRSSTRIAGVIGLVTLAVNLILFLVPRR